ncbi:unnamed protein product [Amaranthus hypochondriacus]
MIELLAFYCNIIIKKGGSQKLSDDAIEESLDKVVMLLAYVMDKDSMAVVCRSYSCSSLELFNPKLVGVLVFTVLVRSGYSFV